MNTYLVQVKTDRPNTGICATQALVTCPPESIVDVVFQMAGNQPHAVVEWALLGTGAPRIKCSHRVNLFDDRQAEVYAAGYAGYPIQRGTFIERVLSQLAFIDSEADAANGKV